MALNPPEIPFLSNIGLLLTYKCTIACPHCIVEAGPHRTEEMLLDDCLDWMEQARSYRAGHIRGLALTGGEPFYSLERLVRISSHAAAMGFIVSVVSNAFWATSREAALETLAQLPAISMISLSTDVYHQVSIPFECIKHATAAAKELGMLYNIAVCTDAEDDPQYQRILSDLREIGEEERVRPSITFPVGRAKTNAKRFHYPTVSEPTVSACTMASSPVVFPDGRVVACIGPLFSLHHQQPLYLGNLHQEPLATILDRAEMNPVLHAIRVWGPSRLVELLKQGGYGSLLPASYIENCICDACYKLLADPRIVEALDTMLHSPDMLQEVAYGRLYYLNETTMLERSSLAAESGQA